MNRPVQISTEVNQPIPVTDHSLYPRVLVVTAYPFNMSNGGGIALTNYFRGWPADKIAQAYISREGETVDRSVCQKFYELNECELRPPILLRCLRAIRRGRASDRKESARLPGGSLIGTIKAGSFGLSRVLRGTGLLSTVDGRISTKLGDFISSHRPEIVFTTLGDLAFIRLVRRIRDSYNTKIAIQIADDWISDQFVWGPIAMLMRSTLEREFRDFLSAASLRYSICRTMSDVYGARYGHEFEPLLSPVDVGAWYKPLEKRSSEGEKFDVVYAGTIFASAQLDSLRDIARAVEKLSVEGVSIRLTIVTPSEFITRHRQNFDFESTTLQSHTSRDELIKILGSANLLVLPINFDAASRRFIGYSMPAKIAAYMASGTPILVYGPSDTPPVVEANRDGFASTVVDRSVGAVATQIECLMKDLSMRRELSMCAISIARDRYDIDVVSNKFREQLHRVTRNSGLVNDE